MTVEELDIDDLICCIILKGEAQLYAGMMVYWVLDGRRYDPFSDPSFRGGVEFVDENSATQFIRALSDLKLSRAEMLRIMSAYGTKQFELSIVIDFDKRLFVNGFREVPIHKYIPDSWTGLEDEPLDYVPNDIRSIWEH